VAFQVVVERLVATVEILDLVALFEAANNNGHSVPQSPDQCVRRRIRLSGRCEFGETRQFALGPLDFYSGQRKVWSYAFQPGENQYFALAAGALADDSVPQPALRDCPAKESHSIGKKIRVAGKLQLFFEQSDRTIFGRCQVSLEFGFAWSLSFDTLTFRL
jgi:hypothetical protein